MLLLLWIIAGILPAGLLLLGSWSITTCGIVWLTLVLAWFLPSDCDISLGIYTYVGKPIESLSDHVVWITGASSGIGAALAVRLTQAGAKVVISARSTDKLNEVKAKCIASGKVKESDVLVLPLDMVKTEEHNDAFQKVLTHFGKLDILVSNAGRSQRGRWEMVDIGVDRDVFDLNVFSLISLSRIVTIYFLKKGGGQHVITSSMAGKFGAPMSASYTASKHALHGYFETLRTEKAGCGLSVTMLCPGPVDSNLLQVAFTEKEGEQLGKDRAGNRMSSERCAQLSATAIANKVAETWICDMPLLILFYVNQYCPTLLKGIIGAMPLSFIMKLRDGRSDAVELEGAEKKSN